MCCLNMKTSFILKNITATFFVVVFLFFAGGCGDKNAPDEISAVGNRSKVPTLHSEDVTTVISDSGITRYRIYAKQWDVFDKAEQPYWDFPKGIYFEKFDENLKVNASIRANYAKFYQRKRLWELKGKVKAINLQGEMFETEHLFWDQNMQKFYSDTLIKITQLTRIITGKGFESNQKMTKYTIIKPEGIVAIDDHE